jgi:hypothetical protein
LIFKAITLINAIFTFQLVTFLIGANDFCLDMCYHEHPEEVIKLHENDVLTVFRTLRDELPRTMLNVVLPPSMNYYFIKVV